MTLKLYNTRTRRKEDFSPIDANNVRMYVCGPTVYDYAHIGNARPAIVFDVLYRLLRHIYGADHVTYVRNITDVDDKINARAAEEGVPIRELTERTVKQYHEDVAALGCLPPDVEPRATEHIEEMKAMIETLVAKGCAYVAEDHVLFHVAAMPDYGKLSRRSLDEMQAGARVEVAPYKRDPMDFVLWKPSKEGEPGWPSPCGIGVPGRPGWHIECSAMSEKHLGKTFDIHGGGIDLVFPHHENEVAQSRCANDTKIMANVWMHNGFLQVEGQKMSKSLGNFVTIRDLTRSQNFGGRFWDGEIIRLAMLKTHYRQPIDWTKILLQEAEANYDHFFNALRRFSPTSISQDFLAALNDDLNTKASIDVLLNLGERANNNDLEAGGQLVASLNLLGLVDEGAVRLGPSFETDERGIAHFDDHDFFAAMIDFIPENAILGIVRRRIIESGNLPIEAKIRLRSITRYADDRTRVGFIWRNWQFVERLNTEIVARLAARKSRNWAEADRIRDELAGMGIALKDAKDPETGEIVTTWEIAR